MDAILALLLQMQMERHLAKDAVKAPQLAPAILELAQHYDVDAELVMKIIIVESRGRSGAYNARTKDTGLMQINKSTAWLYGFSDACLKNWICNLEAGIIILSDMQRFKSYRPCTYNVGPRWHLKKTACNKYENKLTSIK